MSRNAEQAAFFYTERREEETGLGHAIREREMFVEYIESLGCHQDDDGFWVDWNGNYLFSLEASR